MNSEAAAKMAIPPASLPDDDNLLCEILLRLQPQASSLLRASAVCRRWRRLVTHRRFLRRFRVHYRKPPIIGIFEGRHKSFFRSMMNTSAGIPPERLPQQHGFMSILLGCHYGRVLLHDVCSEEAIVICDPITGECSHVTLPSDFSKYTISGAVLCAADDDEQGNHVHGSCPFKVVLVSMHRNDLRLIACVYSSETGVWGNFVSTTVPYFDSATSDFSPGVLAAKSLYWLLRSGDMIEYCDLDRQSLTVIGGPPVPEDFHIRQVIQAEDGGVGQAILSYPSLQMWQRKVDCHGVASWVPWKTIDMHSMLGFPPMVAGRRNIIVGYAEDAGVIFLHVAGSVYMLHLESMQSRRLHEAGHALQCFPLTSFYTAAGDFSSSVDASQDKHWWWI